MVKRKVLILRSDGIKQHYTVNIKRHRQRYMYDRRAKAWVTLKIEKRVIRALKKEPIKKIPKRKKLEKLKDFWVEFHWESGKKISSKQAAIKIKTREREDKAIKKAAQKRLTDLGFDVELDDVSESTPVGVVYRYDKNMRRIT